MLFIRELLFYNIIIYTILLFDQKSYIVAVITYSFSVLLLFQQFIDIMHNAWLRVYRECVERKTR